MSVARRFRLLPPAVLASMALILLGASAVVAFAQQGQPINISEFRRPQNLSPEELEQLRGNCCLPYVSPQQPGSYNPDTRQIECFPNVGLPGSFDPRTGNQIVTPQDQITACTNFALQAGYDTALHYNYQNVNSCDFQCGRDMRLLYCDLSDEAPTCRQDLSEGADMSQVIAFPVDQFADCQAACHPPADVQVSVGCTCGTTGPQGNASAAWNLCTVYVNQNAPNQVFHDFTVQSIRASGDWGQAPSQRMSPIQARVVRPDGTFQNYTWSDISPAGNAIDFEVPNVSIPAGGRFSGTFFVPAGNPAAASIAGQFRGMAETAGDPNDLNNSSYADLSTMQSCRDFTGRSQCLVADAASATSPFLYNGYTLNLTQFAGDPIRLNVLASPPECFEADSDDDIVNLPYGCSVVGDEWGAGPQGEEQIRLMECNLTVDAAAPVIDFMLFPRQSNACPTFTALTVTASIETGAATQPTTLSVTQAKKPCGQCEVCEYAKTRNECTTQDPFEGFCKWLGDDQSGICVGDDENGICPSFYGCCQLVSDTGEDSGTTGGAYWEYIAGTRVEEDFFLPDEESYLLAQQCYQDTVIDDWRQNWPFSPVMLSDDGDAMDWLGDGTGRKSPDVYYWKRICEEVGPEKQSGSPSSAKKIIQRTTTREPWVYFCSDTFDEATYGLARNQGAAITVISPPDCKVFTNQDDLATGTVYYPEPYTPVAAAIGATVAEITPLVNAYVDANPSVFLDPAQEANKYSCPSTCEISTRNRVTCGRPDECEVTTIGACRGGMTFPVGEASLALCERRRGEGAFNPVPREFPL